MKLGKLSRVDLRQYWKHEAIDFTKWLAEPHNIALLADELGIDIQVIQTEGGFLMMTAPGAVLGGRQKEPVRCSLIGAALVPPVLRRCFLPDVSTLSKKAFG